MKKIVKLQLILMEKLQEFDFETEMYKNVIYEEYIDEYGFLADDMVELYMKKRNIERQLLQNSIIEDYYNERERINSRLGR